MFHPIDDARRVRDDADRMQAFCRAGAGDPNHAAAMLGLLLAEKLLGLRPPWRRERVRRVPAQLVLSLSRRPAGRRAFNPRTLGAAND
ncbi:MAG: hypothetical protein ACK4YQ_16525 [Phenylobacterium sp.]|uniref:hypothetical protein n=1 Tax=Phenylobacterium sp. TaxID=1871053 RepID=UPI00391DC7F0